MEAVWSSLLAVGTLVGTTIGAAVAAYFASRRATQQSTEHTHKAVEELKSYTAQQFRKANGIPWRFIEIMPMPTWLKDTNGIMVWINDEYEQQWAIKSSNYEGRTDFDVWPADVAAAFTAHDREVMQSRQVHVSIEEVPEVIGDPESPRRSWRIWKFPVANSSGDLIGVGGFAQLAYLDERCSQCDIPSSIQPPIFQTRVEDQTGGGNGGDTNQQ